MCLHSLKDVITGHRMKLEHIIKFKVNDKRVFLRLSSLHYEQSDFLKLRQGRVYRLRYVGPNVGPNVNPSPLIQFDQFVEVEFEIRKISLSDGPDSDGRIWFKIVDNLKAVEAAEEGRIRCEQD